MNTILKTGTATTFLLLALGMTGCGDDTAGGHDSAGPTAAPAAAPVSPVRAIGSAPLRHYGTCRMTKAEFMAWVAAGTPQRGCVVDGYQPARSFGDDRRQPAH